MAKNDPKDPTPVNQARDFYAACMNTGTHRSTESLFNLKYILVCFLLYIFISNTYLYDLKNIARLETVGIRPLLDILSSFGGTCFFVKL